MAEVVMAISDQELIQKYIEPNPYRPGPADARIVDYGVSVWALVGYWRVVGEDVARVAEDYELPREAVAAAIAYYRENSEAIESRLAANAA
jgi:uncharacterized protein (DUF433 family)